MNPNSPIFTEFIGTKCMVCNQAKPKAQAFCKKCYYKLSFAMRQALYKRFGSGFEEAYIAAKEFFAKESTE